LKFEAEAQSSKLKKNSKRQIAKRIASADGLDWTLELGVSLEL
jgi:hypothetical protein